MSNIITEEEQKAVAAIKKQIGALHIDAQKVLLASVSWAERHFWDWSLFISLGSLLAGVVIGASY